MYLRASTVETANALKDYLKRHHGWFEGTRDPAVLDKYVFATVYRHRGPFIGDSIIKTLQTELREIVRAIPNLNVKDKYGRQTIHLYSLRKLFRTTVVNAVGQDFAEAIIGHEYLLSVIRCEEKRDVFTDRVISYNVRFCGS